MIKEKIKEKIISIEQEENIQVLFACESGSRAWGFPSPDSDYDVRIIYSRPLDWYLSVNEGKDVLQYPIQNEFDICGWDLKKTLSLVNRSNVVVWEWLQSPIIYSQKQNFAKSLVTIANSFFSPKSSFLHYISLTKKVNDALGENKQIKLKKLFYVLRSLAAARWIAEKHTVPPMELNHLLAADWVFQSEKSAINKLVEMKSSAEESYTTVRNPTVDSFISNNLCACENLAENLPSQKGNIETLNIFFKDIVKDEY